MSFTWYIVIAMRHRCSLLSPNTGPSSKDSWIHCLTEGFRPNLMASPSWLHATIYIVNRLQVEGMSRAFRTASICTFAARLHWSLVASISYRLPIHSGPAPLKQVLGLLISADSLPLRHRRVAGNSCLGCVAREYETMVVYLH
jgi:hypothetical protein